MTKLSGSTRQDRNDAILLIGFGNEGRCDDGLGPCFARAVKAIECPGVTVETAYQLNIEDAATIADFDVAVFADATVSDTEPFQFSVVEPVQSTAEFTTHSVSPAGVLGLAHTLFGGTTSGYALAIRGYHFHEFGEGLSDGATENLQAALTFFRAIVAPEGSLRQNAEPEIEGG